MDEGRQERREGPRGPVQAAFVAWLRALAGSKHVTFGVSGAGDGPEGAQDVSLQLTRADGTLAVLAVRPVLHEGRVLLRARLFDGPRDEVLPRWRAWEADPDPEQGP